MQPFRNKGWDYLQQMESIIPVASTKGHNVFAAATTSSAQMATDQLEGSNGEDADLPNAIKAAGKGKAVAVGNVDGFDGDGEGAAEGPMDVDQVQFNNLVSTLSKRKHSDLLNTSIHSLTSGVPTTINSSEPASKKLNSLKGKGKHNATMKSSLSAARAAKITMNWVTDIFEKLVTQPINPEADMRWGTGLFANSWGQS